MAAPVVHFEIMDKDGLKLQKFYADLFGAGLKRGARHKTI
jgi:predicted enzyme related to lactoylglutathione lyase